jgi:hypothetical protein
MEARVAVTDLIAEFRQHFRNQHDSELAQRIGARVSAMPRLGSAILARLAPEPVSPLNAVHLLADLLEALETAIADLLAEGWEPSPQIRENDPNVIVGRLAGVRDLIDRLETHELAIVAKLDRARIWSGLVGRSDDRLRRIAALFHSGTNGLVDLLPRLTDPVDDIFHSGGQQLNFLMARGLIQDARATADGSLPIHIDENYLLCGALPLGDLLTLCTSTLNALDAFYGIYEAEAVEAGLIDAPLEVAPTVANIADTAPMAQAAAHLDLTLSEAELRTEAIQSTVIDLGQSVDEATDAVISAADLVRQYGLHVADDVVLAGAATNDSEIGNDPIALEFHAPDQSDIPQPSPAEAENDAPVASPIAADESSDMAIAEVVVMDNVSLALSSDTSETAAVSPVPAEQTDEQVGALAVALEPLDSAQTKTVIGNDRLDLVIDVVSMEENPVAIEFADSEPSIPAPEAEGISEGSTSLAIPTEDDAADDVIDLSMPLELDEPEHRAALIDASSEPASEPDEPGSTAQTTDLAHPDIEPASSLTARLNAVHDEAHRPLDAA